MEYDKAKEILGKQLELLFKYSEDATNAHELCELSQVILQITTIMIDC